MEPRWAARRAFCLEKEDAMRTDDKTHAADGGSVEASAGAEPVPSERSAEFIDTLVGFTRKHQADNWSGTLASFLDTIVRANPTLATRSSQQYVWDMLRWQSKDDEKGVSRCALLADELFGIDDPIT